MKSDSQVIDELGGTSAVARLFEIRPPSVHEWREKGIPRGRKMTLALMYPDLVPDSWKTNTHK